MSSLLLDDDDDDDGVGYGHLNATVFDDDDDADAIPSVGFRYTWYSSYISLQYNHHICVFVL